MPANAFSYPHANVNTNRATTFRTASEISNARPYVSHHHNDNSHRNQYQTPRASSSSAAAPLVTTVITHTITEEEINDDGYHDDDAPWYQVMRKRRVESGPHHDIITDTIQKVSSSSPSLSSTTPFPYRSPQSTSTSLVSKKQTLSKNFNSFVIDSSSDDDDNNDDSNSIYMID